MRDRTTLAAVDQPQPIGRRQGALRCDAQVSLEAQDVLLALHILPTDTRLPSNQLTPPTRLDPVPGYRVHSRSVTSVGAVQAKFPPVKSRPGIVDLPNASHFASVLEWAALATALSQAGADTPITSQLPMVSAKQSLDSYA